MLATIAFYKGNESITDTLIKLWTRSHYSHCELYFEGAWVTSHPQYGVVSTKKELIYDHANWDYLSFNVNYYTPVFDKYLKDQLGCEYDWKGIVFSQFIPLGVNSDTRWFCSEIVTKLLQILLVDVTLDLQPNKVSPAKLYKVLQNAYN
jgi:hypothetical protein